MTGIYSQYRRHPRQKVELMVVAIGNPPRHLDRVVNLSAGGACIVSPEPLPVGCFAHLYFAVPGENEREHLVAVTGTVVWSKPWCMGLQFDAAFPAIDELLQRISH